MSKRGNQSGKRIFRRSFTYFIPAPPSRKSGYREIEFDKIMSGILDLGFEIEHFNSESTPNGIFVVALLKTKSKKVFEIDLAHDMQDRFRLAHTHSSPDIILDEDEDV